MAMELDPLKCLFSYINIVAYSHHLHSLFLSCSSAWLVSNSSLAQMQAVA